LNWKYQFTIWSISILSAVGFPQSAVGALTFEALNYQTNQIIRQACYGHLYDMPADASEQLKQWLGRYKFVCTDVKSQGENFDLQSSFQLNNKTFSVEDSKRIEKIFEAWRFANIDIQMACNSDWLCMKIRKKLQKQKIPASQQLYNQVENHCRNDLAQYACIQEWFDQEWIKNGVRTPPQTKISDPTGLKFDNLMGSDKHQGLEQISTTTLNFDSMINESSTNEQLEIKNQHSAYQPETRFDNIYASRQKIKLDNTRKTLLDMNGNIASQCQCAFNGDCYKSRSYSFHQITDVAIEAETHYENQKQSVCGNWASTMRGKTSDNPETLTLYLKNGDIILKNLSVLDKNYQDILGQLSDKENEIQLAIKEAEEERQRRADSAFGAAMLTLAAGAVVGANLDIPIDSDTLANAAMNAHNSIANGGSFGESIIQGAVGLTEMIEIGAEQQATLNASNQTSTATESIPSLSLIEMDVAPKESEGGICDVLGHKGSRSIYWTGSSLQCSDGSLPPYDPYIAGGWYGIRCNNSEWATVRTCNAKEKAAAETVAKNRVPN